MSPPTNAEVIPDHTSDDLVMEGESSEDEGDHAPKRTPYRIPETVVSLTMLPIVIKVTVAVCKPNKLAMWEVLKVITVAIVPNWNACCSLYKGEGGGGGSMPACDKRTSRHLEAVYHAFPREHIRRLACLTILHHLILALGID
jgi:hypothetical protein